MTKQKQTTAKCQRELFQTLRELRMMLHEINQKLDHLIERYRSYSLADPFSDSSLREFDR
jgi:hypothetical protein